MKVIQENPSTEGKVNPTKSCKMLMDTLSKNNVTVKLTLTEEYLQNAVAKIRSPGFNMFGKTLAGSDDPKDYNDNDVLMKISFDVPSNCNLELLDFNFNETSLNVPRPIIILKKVENVNTKYKIVKKDNYNNVLSDLRKYDSNISEKELMFLGHKTTPDNEVTPDNINYNFVTKLECDGNEKKDDKNILATYDAEKLVQKNNFEVTITLTSKMIINNWDKLVEYFKNLGKLML